MKKKRLYYFITAIITFSLLTLIYWQLNAVHNTLLISDSYSQYTPLFMRLKSILQGNSSLFYSFEGGLGGNFLGTFFYYLCSPFNLIIVFFQDIKNFFLVVILLKLICASLTSLYFFRYHFPNEKPIYAIVLSVIYVLIGFTTHYFFQPMWLDSVLALPLLLVGIDKFIKKKSFGLYFGSLFYIIITNYYFGFMACIFSFLYFSYQTLNQYSIQTEWRQISKNYGKFLIISFLTVLSTSFVLLPVIRELPEYARTNSSFMSGEDFLFQKNPIFFFQNLLFGNAQNIDFLNADGFYLYMGIFAFVLIVLYFCNKKISLKEKLLTGIMVLIFYISVSGNYFNYIWTAFAKPQFFNGRFVFFFNFFFLYIAAKSIQNIRFLSKTSYLLTTLFFTILLACFYFQKQDNMVLYVNLFLALIYIGLLYVIDFPKIYVPLILSTLILAEMSAEGILATGEYSFTSKEDYQNQNDTYQYITSTITKENDSNFYRIETDTTEPYNAPIYYRYRGIDVFLSTVTNDSAEFFINLGYGSGLTKKNTISYYAGNEVIDSLLGIRYSVFTNSDNIPSSYQILDQKQIGDQSIYIFKNPNALSLGFMVNKDILNVKKDVNALIYQSNIFDSMIKDKYTIYENIPLEEENYHYYFQNTKQKTICVYTAIDSSNGYSQFSVYLNDFNLGKKNDFEIICTPSTWEYDMEISYIGLNSDEHLGTFATYYYPEVWEKVIKELQKNEWNITKYNDTYLSGEIEVPEDKTILFTTITYDSNWEIYVDGKKEKSIKLLNNLLGVELEQGIHTIEIIYRPKSFYIGVIISIISSLILWFFHKKRVLSK